MIKKLLVTAAVCLAWSQFANAASFPMTDPNSLPGSNLILRAEAAPASHRETFDLSSLSGLTSFSLQSDSIGATALLAR